MKLCHILLSLCLGLLAPISQATDKPYEIFGSYKVYYSVFNSSFITPEIAKIYNITRGKDQALINIAVVKMHKDGDSQGIASVVHGSASNLMQQRKKLKFLEVREQEAVYYLAPLRFTNEEVMNFSIQVKPDPNKPAHSLEFSKILYVDR